MQVQSINANVTGNVFSGKRDNIEGFVNLSDEDIRKIAYAQTMSKANPKKHKKVDNAMTMLLPVAGGLAAAATEAKGARKLAFAKGFGGWTAFLLGIGAVFGADKALKNKSEKYRNFAEKHSMLNMFGTMTAAYFAGVGLTKGGARGLKALANTSLYKNVASKVTSLVGKVASKGFVAKSVGSVKSFLAKSPSALKGVAKFAAKAAPWVLIFGSLFHTINYSAKVAKNAESNYVNLKNKQVDLANALRREAEVQRDYLATDAQNAQDLKDLHEETNL